MRLARIDRDRAAYRSPHAPTHRPSPDRRVVPAVCMPSHQRAQCPGHGERSRGRHQRRQRARQRGRCVSRRRGLERRGCRRASCFGARLGSARPALKQARTFRARRLAAEGSAPGSRADARRRRLPIIRCVRAARLAIGREAGVNGAGPIRPIAACWRSTYCGCSGDPATGEHDRPPPATCGNAAVAVAGRRTAVLQAG
jgi:hypothetical protein